MRSLQLLFVAISFLSVYCLTSDLLPNTDVCGLPDVGSNSDDVADADINEFPWLALLQYQKKNSQETGFFCGGVLINNRYVLTAGHCVKNVPHKLQSIRLGEYNKETNPDCVQKGGKETCAPPVVDIPVAETITHEDYNSRSHHYDIALVRLERPIDFTDYVKPICLPLSEGIKNTNFTGSNLIVAGWARTPDRQDTNIKTKLTVPVPSNENCAKIYEQYKVTISDSQFCAGGVEGKDLCNGAGGSSVMTKEQDGDKSNWYAAGIVSFGARCGTKNIPSVNTRISEYIPWIIDKLQA